MFTYLSLAARSENTIINGFGDTQLDSNILVLYADTEALMTKQCIVLVFF